MRHTRGVSLIEMIISMAIFAVVGFMTVMIVTGALGYNARQQATVAAQGKLRRVVEVVGQEFRSSVFGGISNQPYNSNAGQVSFYLLDQGAGYTLVPDVNFNTASSFKILSENEPNLSEIILVDPGDANATPKRLPSAKIFPVTSVVNSGVDTWTINHPGCSNGLAHNYYLQAFGVRSVGFKLDNANKILVLNENGQDYPMAFDITKFELAYVYTKPDGSQERKTTPYIDPITNLPAKVYKQPVTNDRHTLSELQFTLSTVEKGKGDVVRTYTGQIPLLISSNENSGASSSNTFAFEGVTVCN
jgi:prepilin-type N-terminal cleavage/methylation domain-containing protein